MQCNGSAWCYIRKREGWDCASELEKRPETSMEVHLHASKLQQEVWGQNEL